MLVAAPHPAEGKAGMLLRLSDLPVDRDPLTPDDQRTLNLQAANRENVKIVKVYEEYVSASKPEVYREAYEQAVDDLLNQRIQVLYVAALDRLSRRGAGHVDSLVEEIGRVGGRIVFVREGADTSRPNGRLAIAIYAELARAEAENISWRVARWHAAARRHGLWVQRRPFGFLVDDYKLKPHPEEGPIARRVVDEFLAGGSYRGIARNLNGEGIPAPWATVTAEARAKGYRLKPLKTDKWAEHSVSTLLRKPSLAALISHKRRLLYDEEGAPITCGEGIVTFGERARLLAEMERRSTRVREARDSTRVGKRTGGGRPPKYLLTGFVRCAYCLGPMNRTVVNNGRQTRYTCTRKLHAQGCPGGGGAIQGETLEAEVVARFTKRLAACEPGDPLLPVIAKRWMARAVPEGEAERRRLDDALAAVKQTIKDLMDDRYERRLFLDAEDIIEWEQRLARAQSQRDAIQKRKDALGPREEVDIGALLDTELSREAWKETPIARKRDLLGLAVNAVLVLGARRGQRPRKERVVMVWGHEDLPEPYLPEDPPVNTREIIAQLVAEERAGQRPRVIGREAAEAVGGVISVSMAQRILRTLRANQTGQHSS